MLHGTWQATGGGGGRWRMALLLLAGAAILLGSGSAVAAVAEAIVDALIAVAIVTALGIAGLVALVVYRVRKAIHQPSVSYYELPAPEREKPQVAAAQPPMIVNHYHGGTHLHLVAGTDPAIIARAIPLEDPLQAQPAGRVRDGMQARAEAPPGQLT